MKRLFLLLFMFCIASARADYVKLNETEQKEFLSSLQTSLEGIKRLAGKFTQERHLSLFTDPLMAKGVCFFEYPSKLRWEIYGPYQSILIYNGRGVAKFDADEKGLLRKLNLGGSDILMEILSQITAWMKGDFSKSGDVYALSVLKGEKDNLLVLTPKSEEMLKNIKAIELSARKDTNRISSVTIRESKEDFIKISFYDEKINPEIPAVVFDLSKPEKAPHF
ncbi:MAG: hypothetical protein A2017_12480 [Lentisphaerae bacterium GWF2_44_16]|nr:MAG: hypothetical protein A2017_12480 [Lentisphaerae bacterium GWF2_44_16]